MEDWVTIKNLKARNPDMGTRKIAHLLGISRNTVRKALESKKVPKYQRKEIINPAIVPYVDIINTMYWQKHFKGSRILNEITSKGFKGSKNAFYRYFKKIRSEEPRYYTPYETAPGEQAQFDWSFYTVLIDNVLTRVVIFSYILGFCRYVIFDISLSDNQGSVFEAMENALRETGGVPERIQTDNAKSFVVNASKDHFKWNSRYLQFCGHYGFKPSRSLPGHPWSKGKVERPFLYLEDHFIKGNTFDSFEDFYNKLKEFQDQMNDRIHGTIKVKPVELFQKEKPSLSTLPKQRYVNIEEEVRKVTSDCLLSFNGSKYSVPWMFAGRMVWIKVSKGYYLHIYSEANKLIANHRLAFERGQVVIDPAHYKGSKCDHGNWKRLADMFHSRYGSCDLFLEKLRAQKRINARYHLGRILDIASCYHIEDVRKAIECALAYNIYNYSFFQAYLEKHFNYSIDVTQSLDIKAVIMPDTNVKRNLNFYKMEKLYEQ